ncbi:MAG: squalene/phytoene synthase family protein [Hyphomicrobium sp.]
MAAVDTSSSATRDLVREAARAHGYDRYAAALLAPPDKRDDLITLAAYFGEMARISLTSADVAIGEIRLQWWRDAILGFGQGSRTGSPVADALQEVQVRLGLPKDLLLSIIEGRSRELYEDGIADEAELVLYLEETEGAAFRLLAVVLGAEASPTLDDLASAAAASYGRMRLALDLPLHLEKQRLPLPPSLYSGGRDPRGLAPQQARSAARALTLLLVREAEVALASFRDVQRLVPASIFAAFLPLALVKPYLRVLDSPRHDVLLELADISPLSRLWWLWLARWRGCV